MKGERRNNVLKRKKTERKRIGIRERLERG